MRVPPKQRKAEAGIFSERAYFAPESGQMKGQNPAVAGATDGGGSVAKRTSRLLLGVAYSIGQECLNIADHMPATFRPRFRAS